MPASTHTFGLHTLLQITYMHQANYMPASHAHDIIFLERLLLHWPACGNHGASSIYMRALLFHLHCRHYQHLPCFAIPTVLTGSECAARISRPHFPPPFSFFAFLSCTRRSFAPPLPLLPREGGIGGYHWRYWWILGNNAGSR